MLQPSELDGLKSVTLFESHQATLQKIISQQKLPSLLELQNKFEKRETTIPAVSVTQPPSASYDDVLLPTMSQEVH